MSPATACHVGGIDTIKKPRHIGLKPKFLCRLRKGDHLTCMCPATAMVQEEQSLSDIPSGSKSCLVSQHYNPSSSDTMVMSMQSSAHTTLLLGGDVSLNHVVLHRVQPAVASMQSSTNTTLIFGVDASLELVVSHPIQPMVEKVVVLMQYSSDPTLLLESDKSKEVTSPMQSSINPTLLLGGDASLDHVLRIYSPIPSEQGHIPLSLSMLLPSPRMVSFNWNDLVEPRLPSLQGSSASILSSSAWKVLGFLKILLAIYELMNLDRIHAR
jgi:hypothetical protein